jgi:hypothetical protein
MKKKKRNRSHRLQATPASSYQPLTDTEEEEPGGTEARGSGKPGVDAILEQNTASPQEKTSAMRRSGKFRSMLSKLIAYCVSRGGK